MLNCRQVTELCSGEPERGPQLGEKVSLRMHLMMCSGCTNHRQQMKTLRPVVQAYADGQGVGDDARPEASD